MSDLLTYNVQLYTNVPFCYEDNFIIDSFEDFLNPYAQGTALMTNLQPITPSVDNVIKLQVSESFVIPMLTYNYLKLIRQATGIYTAFNIYYFITKLKRLANNVIEFTLKMDVLNTLGSYITSSNFYTDKTLLLRQHEDRFSNYSQSGTTLTTKNKVDYVSEGINVGKKLFYKNAVNSSVGDTSLKWYLVYETADEVSGDSHSAVSTYLCADKSLLIKKGVSSNNISFTNRNITDLGRSIYILSSDQTTYFSIDVQTQNPTGSYTFTSNNCSYVAIGYESGTIHIIAYSSLGAIVGDYELNSFSFNTITAVRLGELNVIDFNSSIFSNAPKWDIVSNRKDAQYILPLGAIQKTNPKLIKIISCPYCPRNVSISINDEYSIDNFFNYQYISSSVPAYPMNYFCLFKSPLSEQELINTQLTFNDINNYETIYNSIIFGDLNQTRALQDTKLLHSDFYCDKFIYDSFSFEVKHELLKAWESGIQATRYNIEYKTTNTINSNLLFKITPQAMKRVPQVLWYDIHVKSTDFDNILISSRNNEITIYDNAYVNYLKTGFNYDKKAKIYSDFTRWSNLGVNITKGVISGAVLGQTAGAVLGGAGDVVGTLTSQLETNNSFAQKLNSLQMQSTNVSGSDDINLMEYYSNNKLLHLIYKPITRDEKMLDDMFYYYGYARNIQGKPNFTSRKWFNFVQCEAVYTKNISYGGTSLLSDTELRNELTNKLKEGITNFHALASTEPYANRWNLEQTKENWEVSLL